MTAPVCRCSRVVMMRQLQGHCLAALTSLSVSQRPHGMAQSIWPQDMLRGDVPPFWQNSRY